MPRVKKEQTEEKEVKGRKQKSSEQGACGLTNKLDLYYNTISRTPLLTPEEEKSLFFQYRQCVLAELLLGFVTDDLKVTDLMIKQATVDQKTPNDYENKELVKSMIGRDRIALEGLIRNKKAVSDKIVNSNLKLAIKYARETFNDFDADLFMDSVQNATLGLMKAVTKFDYTKGFKFGTYATWWIKQSIDRESRQEMIRPPEYITEKIKRLKRAAYIFEQKNGYSPSIDELSEASKIPVEEIKKVKKYAFTIVSIDTQLKTDTDTGDVLRDLIPDKGPGTETEAIGNVSGELLYRILDVLDETEWLVIYYKYGFSAYGTITMKKISELSGLSKEEIYEVEKSAIDKLKKYAKTGGIDSEEASD